MSGVVAVLFSISTIEAVVAVFAFVLVLKRGYGRPGQQGRIVFFGHLALYWTTNVVLRLFFEYVGPSVWMTTWGAAVFLHLGGAEIADYYIKRFA